MGMLQQSYAAGSKKARNNLPGGKQISLLLSHTCIASLNIEPYLWDACAHRHDGHLACLQARQHLQQKSQAAGNILLPSLHVLMCRYVVDMQVLMMYANMLRYMDALRTCCCVFGAGIHKEKGIAKLLDLLSLLYATSMHILLTQLSRYDTHTHAHLWCTPRAKHPYASCRKGNRT